MNDFNIRIFSMPKPRPLGSDYNNRPKQPQTTMQVVQDGSLIPTSNFLTLTKTTPKFLDSWMLVPNKKHFISKNTQDANKLHLCSGSEVIIEKGLFDGCEKPQIDVFLNESLKLITCIPFTITIGKNAELEMSFTNPKTSKTLHIFLKNDSDDDFTLESNKLEALEKLSSLKTTTTDLEKMYSFSQKKEADYTLEDYPLIRKYPKTIKILMESNNLDAKSLDYFILNNYFAIHNIAKFTNKESDQNVNVGKQDDVGISLEDFWKFDVREAKKIIIDNIDCIKSEDINLSGDN